MQQTIVAYFDTLADVTRNAAVTDKAGHEIGMERGFAIVRDLAHKAHNGDNKLIFIGNGGSQGMSSHLAIDYSKNGGLRALAFTDAAALTCLGNDLGYENVFAKQIDFHARPGDLVIATSSSGNSPNIINGVTAARNRGCHVVTFSGFKDDNKLRRLGDVNFYVSSLQYGFVEIAHLSLCHAILDIDMGWDPRQPNKQLISQGV
jgi:D-sedoheptulose 7-phosphate isomerase